MMLFKSSYSHSKIWILYTHITGSNISQDILAFMKYKMLQQFLFDYIPFLIEYFQSNFRFIAKLSGKQGISYTSLIPHMHNLLTIGNPNQSDTFVITDDVNTHILSPKVHMKPQVSQCCHSMGFDKYVMIYIHHYNILQNLVLLP